MKYRLTVKGQVALATVLLVAAFGAGTLVQLDSDGPAALQPAAAAAVPASSAPAETSAPMTDPAESTAMESIESPATEGDAQSESPEMTATVYFDPDRWEIKAQEIQKITAIADAMAKDPELKVLVEGNINKGSGQSDTAFGKDLSLKRAQVVVQVLLGKGVDASRIVVKSNGSSKPSASEPENAWMNRRTDLILE